MTRGRSLTPSGSLVRNQYRPPRSREAHLDGARFFVVAATKGVSDVDIGTMTGTPLVGMVDAMSDSRLAFAVVVAAAIAFVAAVTVAFVPVAVRLLEAFA